MRSDLTGFFSAGRKLELPSNQPFKASSLEGFSLLESGEINVFLSSESEGMEGRRQHVATLQPGALFPPGGAGLGSAGQKRFFLLVPVSDSVLLSRELSEFDAFASGHAASVAEAIEAWLYALCAGLEKYATIDRAPLGDAAPEARQEIKNGASFSPSKGLWWVDLLSGSVLFCGDEEFPLFTAPSALVVTPRCWLTALEDCRVRCRSTEELVLAGESSPLLAKINENVSRCLLTASVYGKQRELANEESDRRNDAELTKARIGELSSLISDSASGVETGSSPLAMALNAVAKACRLEIKFPLSEQADDGDLDSAIVRFADANQWRVRRVSLPPGFERHEAGVAIGFHGEKREPVFLELKGASSSWIDPLGGVKKPLDAKVASAMADYAYCVYESLPKRALSWSDVVAFLFRGSSSTWRWLLVAGLLSGLIGLAQPIAMAYVSGKIIPTANIPELWQLLILLLSLAISHTAFDVVTQLLVLSFGTKQLIRVQTAVFDRVFRLPIDFFRNYNAGDLCSRVLSTISFQETVFKVLSQQFIASIFSLCSLAMLFYYSWKLALFALPLSLLYVATMSLLFVRTQAPLKEMADAHGREAGFLKQLFDGIAKIRGAGAERRVLNRFLLDFVAARKAGYEYNVYSGRIAVFSLLFPGVVYIVFFYLVGEKWRGSLEIPGFLAFLTAYASFQQGLIGFVNGLWQLGSMRPDLKRLEPVMRSELEARAGQLPPGRLDGRVELSHVSFRYSTGKSLVLKDVSIEAKPGEFIAIVGPSGAGKSSLVRLLLGFERPESGSVLYSGSDLAELDVDAVRRQLGVILQNSRVMPGSILENIVTGTNCGIAEAEAAVRMAALDNDIAKMPMGLFTMVADGLISGGQQQRILIARALIGRPAIIIMDESTSALDNETQEIVRKNVEKLRATRVVVAHRLSTIINADRIYVLENGSVSQVGNFAELMSVDGTFKRLAQRQLL